MTRPALALSIPQVIHPAILLAAMFCIVAAAIVDDDWIMHAAGPGLLVDAALAYVGAKLREEG